MNNNQLKKRPQHQINEILSKTGDTVILKNFVSTDKLQYLYDFFQNHTKKTTKKSGPITLSKNYIENDIMFQMLFNSIQQKINLELKIFGGNFFQTNNPYIIHNDVPFENEILPGKCIVIPIKKIYSQNWDWAPSDTDAKFYIFDQMYFHAPVKCFKNNPEEIYSPFNIPLYDYNDIYKIHVDNRVPDIDANHLTINNRQWLEGFSVEKECVWVPGDVIVFDCARLHCSSNFLNNGIEQKTGLSLFTSYV